MYRTMYKYAACEDLLVYYKAESTSDVSNDRTMMISETYGGRARSRSLDYLPGFKCYASLSEGERYCETHGVHLR